MKHSPVRLLCGAFVAWHISCELLTGASQPVKNWVKPLIGFYTDGLRMTNTWGMFSARPPNEEVVVLAETEQRGSVVLSTNYTSQRSGWSRILDVRMRKIQTYLKEESHRKNWGMHYLSYFCREALVREPSTRRVELWIFKPAEISDTGALVEPKVGSRVLKKNCTDGGK